MNVALILTAVIVAVWFITAPPEDDTGGIVFHGFVGIPLAVIALLIVWLIYFAAT